MSSCRIDWIITFIELSTRFFEPSSELILSAIYKDFRAAFRMNMNDLNTDMHQTKENATTFTTNENQAFN